MFAQTPAPSAALMDPAALKEKAPEKFNVKFATTAGEFTIEVNRSWSPLGADRFYNLVKNHFFDQSAFFRFVTDFVIQFGLPADPQVATVWLHATIPDDRHNNSNDLGTVVFANAGPGTRTTQIFINMHDNADLDSQGFTPFGRVSSGMSVVDKLYSGYGEKPEQGRIRSEGKAYLDRNFPKLDTIASTTIVVPPAKK